MQAAPCNRPEPAQFLEKDTRGQQGLIFAPPRHQETKTVQLGKPSSPEPVTACFSLGSPQTSRWEEVSHLPFFWRKKQFNGMHVSEEPTGYHKPQFKTRAVFYKDIFQLLHGVSEASPCTGLNTSELPNQFGTSEVDQVLQNQSLLASLS